MSPALAIADGVPLAPLTTLQLGGAARHLIEVASEVDLLQGVAWAEARRLPLLVLGGGSNVVVADGGFDGVVLRMGIRGVRFEAAGAPAGGHAGPTGGARMLVHAAAGEPWDPLVAETVARGWAGLECLAGIPGLVGATPIQNVGAYGQEVAHSIRAVRVLDRASGGVVDLAPESCGFGYRDSVFKRCPGAYVVLAVTFALIPGGAPCVRYRELGVELQARASGGAAPTLMEVSAAVRDLRRRKSMLLDPADPNTRSVGSFFTNPILSAAEAARVLGRAVTLGAARAAAEVPQFPAAGGGVKLSAAWLIEQAGFPKGFRRGAVGISTRHALALIHAGGGTTTELVQLARDIQRAVQARFGVGLIPEPVLVGDSWPA